MSETGSSTILGTNNKISSTYAEFTNSKLANILDFDDTYLGISHPGATIIGAALGVAEEVNASGEGLIKAIL